MDDFRVWIPGPPQAKGRPRFRVINGHVQTYTPKTTQAYEQLIAERIRAAYPDWRQYHGPVELELEFRMPVPKSLEPRFRYHANLLCPRVKETLGGLRINHPSFLPGPMWKPCRTCKPENVAYWYAVDHLVKPDLDNLEKSLMDGLQKSEVIKDDSQVVKKSSVKAYAEDAGVFLFMKTAD